MIVSLHEWGTGRSAPKEVPDEPVQEFIQWLLATSNWKQQPRLLYNRGLKLRKKLMENVKNAESALDIEKFPEAGPELKRSRVVRK